MKELHDSQGEQAEALKMTEMATQYRDEVIAAGVPANHLELYAVHIGPANEITEIAPVS